MEIPSQYAENTHFLEPTHDPQFLQHLLKVQLLDQSLKSFVFIETRRISFNSDLQKGQKIGAPYDQEERQLDGTAECVRKKQKEHEISQMTNGFDLFMKEATRQDSSTARIQKNSLAYFRTIEGHFN